MKKIIFVLPLVSLLLFSCNKMQESGSNSGIRLNSTDSTGGGGGGSTDQTGVDPMDKRCADASAGYGIKLFGRVASCEQAYGVGQCSLFVVSGGPKGTDSFAPSLVCYRKTEKPIDGGDGTGGGGGPTGGPKTGTGG